MKRTRHRYRRRGLHLLLLLSGSWEPRACLAFLRPPTDPRSSTGSGTTNSHERVTVAVAVASATNKRGRPIDPAGWPDRFPAQEHCSRCGLCESSYVTHVSEACSFLPHGPMAHLEDWEGRVHGRSRRHGPAVARNNSNTNTDPDDDDEARWGVAAEPVYLVRGKRPVPPPPLSSSKDNEEQSAAHPPPQWTGVVSGLAEAALEEGLVDAVVCIGAPLPTAPNTTTTTTTSTNATTPQPSSGPPPSPVDWATPEPLLARTVADVRRGRGVKPSLAPTLRVLDLIERADPPLQSLLVCGVGCAVQALRAVEADLRRRNPALRDVLVVGTNCADNSPTPRAAQNFVQAGIRTGEASANTKSRTTSTLPNVLGYEFMADFQVHVKLDNGDYLKKPYFCLPPALAEPSIAPSCLACFDYTNALADVVVGYMGAPWTGGRMDDATSTWQTLTIRNARGRRLVDAAVRRQRVVVGPPATGTGHHQTLAVSTVQSDTLVQAWATGRDPPRDIQQPGMPLWAGRLLARFLQTIGPKGMAFGRYSIDYHVLRNYLYVLSVWGPEGVPAHVPPYAQDLVAEYREAHPAFRKLETQILAQREVTCLFAGAIVMDRVRALPQYSATMLSPSGSQLPESSAKTHRIPRPFPLLAQKAERMNERQRSDMVTASSELANCSTIVNATTQAVDESFSSRASLDNNNVDTSNSTDTPGLIDPRTVAGIAPIALTDLNAFSSNVSYFYLKNEIGLSEEAMWKITYDAGPVLGMTAHNLRRKVKVLRDLMDLTDEQLKTIIERQPSILQLSADKNLSPTILNLLRSLDLSRHELKNLIVSFPGILTYSNTNLRSKIRFFTHVLGLSTEETRNVFLKEPTLFRTGVHTGLFPRMKFLVRDVQVPVDDLKRIVVRHPRILSYSLEKNLIPKLVYYCLMTIRLEPQEVAQLLTKYPEFMVFDLDQQILPITRYFLHDLDYSLPEFQKILLRYPRLVTNSLDKIKHVVGYLRFETDLSAAQVRRVLYQAPSLLGLATDTTVRNKVRYVREALNLNDDQWKQLLAGMPSILLLSIENNLKPKLSYLRESFRYNVTGVRDALLRLPTLLGYSLEKRIIPRMEALQNAGVEDPGCITVCIPMTEASFDKWMQRRIQKAGKHETNDATTSGSTAGLPSESSMVETQDLSGRIIHWTRERRPK